MKAFVSRIVNEASKCPKVKISYFQSVVRETCSKLDVNSVHNLKASMKYYVLAHYVSGQAVQVLNDCTSVVEQILQYLPNEVLLELAAATNGYRFYTKNISSQTNCGC